jgi:hypothetical protein
LRPAQNNYLLDGLDNNSNLVDFLNGTAYVVRPPVDALQEFKVETSNFSAEMGRAGGAVLNATIKSGTNQIHGALWEFLRNDARWTLRIILRMPGDCKRASTGRINLGLLWVVPFAATKHSSLGTTRERAFVRPARG